MDELNDQEIEYDPDIEYDPSDQQGRRRPEIDVDPEQFQYYCDLQRTRQYLPYAVAGALIGAGVGAAIWLGLTAFTSIQIRWTPVAVGFLAGFLARGAGRGIDRIFGVMSALMAALGILAGNVLAGCWLVARQTPDAGFADIISALTPVLGFKILQDLYAHIDLMFDAIGLLLAYWVAIKRVRLKDAVGIELPPGLRRAA